MGSADAWGSSRSGTDGNHPAARRREEGGDGRLFLFPSASGSLERPVAAGCAARARAAARSRRSHRSRPPASSAASRPLDVAEARAVRERSRRLDAVRERQALSDRAHPARQLVERDVRAGEDEQEAEHDVREHRRLADDAARCRPPTRPSPVHENALAAITSTSGAIEPARQVGSPRITLLTVSENAATKKPFTITGTRAAEEERQPAGGRDEDVAERLLVALARDRLAHREEARAPTRTGARCRARRTRPTRARPTGR